MVQAIQSCWSGKRRKKRKSKAKQRQEGVFVFCLQHSPLCRMALWLKLIHLVVDEVNLPICQSNERRLDTTPQRFATQLRQLPKKSVPVTARCHGHRVCNCVHNLRSPLSQFGSNDKCCCGVCGVLGKRCVSWPDNTKQTISFFGRRESKCAKESARCICG